MPSENSDYFKIRVMPPIKFYFTHTQKLEYIFLVRLFIYLSPINKTTIQHLCSTKHNRITTPLRSLKFILFNTQKFMCVLPNKQHANQGQKFLPLIKEFFPSPTYNKTFVSTHSTRANSLHQSLLNKLIN
jgi:hypothetical protein